METKTPASSHACLISYASTDATDIPLILVVGREPNGDTPVTPDKGTYDFRSSPNCAFWNVAYGLLGAAASPELTTSQVKRLAVARDASPILFADALPHSIDNAMRNKATRRAAFTDAEIERHVVGIFAHDQLIQRTKLVLLSGHDARFARSAKIFAERCASLNIPMQSLPFFYGTNVPKIRTAVTPQTQQLLNDIARTFKAFEPIRCS